MTVEFAKGFIRACDEAGMDAEAVIKQAQQLLQPAVAPAPAAPAPIQAPASAPAAAAPSTPTITGAAAPTPQGPVPVPAPAAPEPSAGKFMPPVRRYGQDLNAFNSQIGQQQRIQGYSGAGSQALGMKTSSVKGSKVMQTQSTVKSASVKSVMAFIKSMLSGAGNHVAELAGAAAGVSPHGGSVLGRFKAPFIQGNRLLRSARGSGVGVGNALRMNPRLIGEALGSTAVAASPAALVTSALMDKNSAFLEGFQLKCAELNLDPVKLYKQALYVPGFGPIKGRNWDLSWVPGHERYAAYNKAVGSMPVTGGGFGEDLHEKLTRFGEAMRAPDEGQVGWSGGPRERRLALLRTQSRMQALKNENDQMLADAEAVLARLQQKGRDIANPPAKSKSSFAERMYAMNRGNVESWNKSPVAPRPVRLSPELLRSVTAPSAPYVPPPALPPALQRQLAKNVAGAGAPQLVSALPPDLA